ncbi:MAG: flagellar hook-length control protein FliK [Rhodoferax sp.]
MTTLARAAGKLKGTQQKGDSKADIDPAATELTLGKTLSTGDATQTGALPLSIDTNLTPNVAQDTSALLAQAAHWSAAPATNAEKMDPNVAGVTANLSGVAKGSHGPAKADGTAVSNAAKGDSVSELVGKVGKTQKDAFARLASAQAALTAPVDTNKLAIDVRQALQLQKVVETTPLGPVATALATANSLTPLTGEESIRERSVFRTNATDSTSSIANSTYSPSASAPSGANAPDPATSADTFVAEKVAYWISNDVQNAELKLDGIGDKPVEVSIRMQGNEAHIAFRSDELQARAALENAGIHLKDMLQREGVVLSGVSVGTSGAGESGDKGGKSRQGARQSGVATVQPARIDKTPGPGRVSGGALDLFV